MFHIPPQVSQQTSPNPTPQLARAFFEPTHRLLANEWCGVICSKRARAIIGYRLDLNQSYRGHRAATATATNEKERPRCKRPLAASNLHPPALLRSPGSESDPPLSRMQNNNRQAGS